MHLATRCPFCETVFRLQPAQLAQRRGLVRCGHCQEVFDASSSLFDVSEGGDFSTAKPVAAAAAIEALSGVRQPGPDSSGDAWAPGAPAPEQDSTSISRSTLDSRLRDHASSVPLAPLPLGGTGHATVTSGAPRQTEPELPAGAFSAPLPADDEPTLADAPLEPFAYPADDAVDEPPVVPPSAPAAPPRVDDEAPRVWHKVERPEPSMLDERARRGPASLHGMRDNEPHFGAAGLGAAGLGATGLGAAGFGAAGADAAGFGAAAGASGAGGPGGPRPPGGPSSAPSSGEPFSVNPPISAGDDPFPVMRETRPVDAGRVGWIAAGVVLAALLVIALLAQLAWWQRETIMVNVPRSQILYAQACAHLGCQLTPPHDIEGLLVEPSDLRQIDGPHKLELKMPLHNRLNIALAYPAIELTLLDDQNNVAVRRVLWPQDYVPPGTVIAAGLPAHATQTMIVHLDTGTAIASNFRVQIFYP
ncbi:putative Zn finger-like uncharacterized protein [Paraburkholderia sp. JPY158]|uniref:Putative Zn finger-like uncharacterized protein n=1 Tax=Paraburkholderia atlantica TaxID=2654982 RepID=A0A7W8QCJ3_PARAM|nr:zinc-ribbon and DUF3426 domain-containing protein [Paraburkholderia atlantica]MBB5427927.1 putative Zn finger-like uncharacterized protein [Paraburkholderia atlantica]